MLERLVAKTERTLFKPIYAIGGLVSALSPSPLATFLTVLVVELVGGSMFNSEHDRWEYAEYVRLDDGRIVPHETLDGQIAFPESLLLAAMASLATWRFSVND